jgi:hypothetical protein
MPIREAIKKTLMPFRSWMQGDTRDIALRSQDLLGRIASLQVRGRQSLSSLSDAEFKVTSQWGEDGIIDWLIERAQIPPALRTFIEFGVEDYRESNTRFLLKNRNWRGLIMDSSPALVDAVQKDGLAWRYDLTPRPAFITRENINELLASAGFGLDIGLLSIDVDGIDYWVWEAIEAVRPVIVICEYNAVFGDIHPVSIPYDSTFNRTRANHSNLYFGASIGALCSLAVRKGYRFLGTTSAANNAFFIREDYSKPLLDGSIGRIHALPSIFRESRDASGQLNYIGGVERLRHIAGMSVINVETGAISRLGDLGSVYSQEWLEVLGEPS